MGEFNVVLVRPNYDSHLVTAPLGLGYLSSYLKSKNYNCRIIDGLNRNYSIDKIISLCQGADLVGINCCSAYFLEVIKLSRALKDQGFTVVIGGPHASSLPELTLEETDADYIVIGEGELILAQLVEHIRNNKVIENVPGLMSRASRKLVKAALTEGLDLFPYPDWREMDPRTYKRAPHGGLVKAFPVAPITSTRGCPFECTFCASPFLWDRKIRFRTPQNVVDEIEYLIKEFKVKEIHFEDDNLTLKRKHIEDICSLILKRNIKINWATPNGIRVDALDLDLLKLMKKSGCYAVAFGIESGNQEILNNVKKNTSLEKIEKAVRLTRKLGIVSQGFFIFGLPGETNETICQTLKFAKTLPLDKAQFLLLDVLPGSELWSKVGNSQLLRQGYQSYHEATWIPPGLSKEALNNSLGCAFRSFFFRPRQLMFLARYFKLSQVPFIIKRIADFRILPFSKYA